MTIQDVMTPEREREEAREVARDWLQAFAAVMEGGEVERLRDLFLPAATWRDFVGFTWDVTNYLDLDAAIESMQRLVPEGEPRDFVLSREQEPTPFYGGILVFFDFQTHHRVCRGYVRLDRSDDGWRGSTLMTQAEGLVDHPDRKGEHRPAGKEHGCVADRRRWSDQRLEESDFRHEEPRVVILGAGHNGLTIGARLSTLGVSNLVVERNDRIGDQWRQRYASLALHSLLGADHLAYMPFPQTWTEHTPKDKFADHLEGYARTMDLNVWTGTDLESAEYDDQEQRWTITLRRSDGTQRVMHPAHFVIATGLNGTPRIPDVPGIDDFRGRVEHSGEFQGGGDFSGRRALVVGSGVSGHEIAHDLYEHGADVTLLQRSANYVINFETFNQLWYPVYAEGSDLQPEYADMVAYGAPNATNVATNQYLVKQAAEMDGDLLARLQARGFKLEWGPEDDGIIGSHMAGRDSYHINIGAAELIADDKIHLKQGIEVERATPTGVVFSDGSELDVDVIVFATGYHPMLETIRPLLGRAADKVQKVYGLADDGEYSEAWRRSRQPGLWFGTGFVTMARFHSKPMTILIKAIEAGLLPADPGR